jgi:aspartate carbamoyltransferase catalytic subunit
MVGRVLIGDLMVARIRRSLTSAIATQGAEVELYGGW